MNTKMSLVGYTGFVGSNIYSTGHIDYVYNSKNIINAFGTSPDCLIYSGLRAEKYIANKFPEKDFDSVLNAINNIKQINPHRLVLISTIDVYDRPKDVYEDTEIKISHLAPYGKNRLYFENWVENNFSEYLIVRLPGLFGENIKKNFIYDFINKIPRLLTSDKLSELKNINQEISNYYFLNEDGFYQCKELTSFEYVSLLHLLDELNFSALNFTDSRGIYQFYNLKNLYDDIQTALKNGIKKLNLATEPINIGELHEYITNQPFVNEFATSIPHYDFKSHYSKYFNNHHEYLYDKKTIMSEIATFILDQQKRKGLDYYDK
nr:NAD-dependent epimerase/dehydratase family protein [uncultured Faecalimonas sp.]